MNKYGNWIVFFFKEKRTLKHLKIVRSYYIALFNVVALFDLYFLILHSLIVYYPLLLYLMLQYAKSPYLLLHYLMLNLILSRNLFLVLVEAACGEVHATLKSRIPTMLKLRLPIEYYFTLLLEFFLKISQEVEKWRLTKLLLTREITCKSWYRSSHRRCSVKKVVLINSAKFTVKRLCQRLFF